MPAPGGLSLYHDLMDADPDIARRLHDALTAVGARASVRVLDDGQWVVRLMRGIPRQERAYPPEADQDEWLGVLADRLEAAAGVRPSLELEAD